ncbi:MAG: sulfite exporter TauE/SafE family protein, partial [Hyphomicrobiales bacterium]|nr:sulfite exporter TauE/SafE family protein [Hyphomicrobiales bacterium]
MTVPVVAILFVAGLLGGVANAVAGGATLITFPALLHSGLAPLVANASNSVATTPGQLIAAFADRSKLPAFDGKVALALGAALAGGAAGAWLLLLTPSDLFTRLVPALIGVATLMFAFGKRLQGALRAAGVKLLHARPPLVGLASVYGGYFGAGLGVLLLSAIGVTGDEELLSANALKNLVSTVVSATTIVVFGASGIVSWPQTLVVLAGAACGGWIGGRALAV